jgi:1-acyl-sn-glycerol-3-phosphate acyltransferase
MPAQSMALKPAFSQVLAQSLARLVGWKLTGEFPDIPKYVMIGAPHTSNWDFVFIMLLMFGKNVRFNWVGKDSLFKGPMGGLYKSLGGVPVRRDERRNFVSQIVDEFNRRKELIIAISPEGTRSATRHWKTGFYYMAIGAGVPILMAYIDYPRKEIGVGPLFEPTGDINADFEIIRQFYKDKKGKYPDLHGEIELKPRDS